MKIIDTIGSESYTTYYPYRSEICGFVKSFGEYTLSIVKSDESISARHNAFVDYVVSFLLFSTGHRPVIDVFCDISDIDTNSGMCTINDKVSSDAHQFRLVALAEISCKQINLYIDHLSKLSRILYNRGDKSRSIACAINRIIQKKGAKDLPLFFYLNKDLTKTKSITTLTIAECWERHWGIKINFGRKFLATELERKNVPPDLISAQLGHQGGIDHPFGLTSIYTPRVAIKYLAQQINSVMVDIGWETLSGLGAGGRISSENIRWSRKKYCGHETDILGPEARALNRKYNKNLHREIIRSVLEDVYSEGLPKKFTEHDLESLIKQVRIKADIEKCSLNLCLRLFYRWLASLRYSGHSVPANYRTFCLDGEGMPFPRDIVEMGRTLDRARDKFEEYLYKKGKHEDKFTIEQRLAEIIISAPIYGCIPDASLLKGLHTAIVSSAYQLEKIVFVDILSKDKSKPVCLYRWYLESISLSLFVGLHRQYGEIDLNSINMHLFKQALRDICKSITEVKGDTYKVLAQLGHTALSLEKPGYIRSVFKNEIAYRPLPLTALVRLVSKKRLKCDEGSLEKLTPEHLYAWLPDMSRVGSKQDRDLGLRFIKDLRIIVNNIASVAPKGYDRRCKQLKKKLEQHIEVFFEKEERTQACGIVAVWAIWLCRFGTQQRSNLAYNTVRQYTFMIGVPIIEKAYDKNIFEMDESEFEEFYLDVLEYWKREDTAQVEHVIRDFHYFLIETWGVEDLDWSVVSAAKKTRDKRLSIDANFISHDEYLISLRNILRDKNCSKIRQYQHAVLLILGYRFGLRFGEVYNIQWRDIQYLLDFSLIYVIVRHNVYRELKSTSGIRQIPLVGTLIDIEINVLRAVLTDSAEHFENDAQAPLMAGELNSRMLIDRGYAAQFINSVLKNVTGDMNIRFHHLRHSWSMRMGVASTAIDKGSASYQIIKYIAGDLNEKDIEILCGTKDMDCRNLKAISRSIGHANEKTTISSYMHTIDIMAVNDFVELNRGLQDYAIGYALGIRASTFRKRKSRLPKNDRSIKTILRNELSDKIFPYPKIETEERTELDEQYDDVQSIEELKPLIIERLLRVVRQRHGDFSGIADKFFLNDEIVGNILENALIIEKISGYSAYDAILTSKDPMHVSNKISYQYKNKHTEILRSQKILTMLQKKMKKYSEQDFTIINEGLNAWSEAYNPGSGLMIFTSIEDMAKYISMINLLDVGKLVHVAKLHSGFEIGLTTLEKMKNMGIRFLVNQSIPRNFEKTDIRRKHRVSLKPIELPQIIKTGYTLYRLYFVLLVWMDTMSKYENQKNG